MKITHKLIFGSSLISLLVFAAEIPEALPAGFLEQLPVLLEMDEDEYAAFLAFRKQEISAVENQVEQKGDNDEN